MKRIITTLATLICALSLVAQTTTIEAPQTDALYRLPMSKGAKVAARALAPTNLGVAMHQNLRDFCAWEISTTNPTDIVAPREGTVESANENSLLILHPDGIYTRLSALEGVCVAVGDKVEKGDKVGTAYHTSKGTWRVWMEVFHLKSNPTYGTEAQSGNYERLVQYINPIFSTRGKCKTQLTDGGAYTVKARTWCWPWE